MQVLSGLGKKSFHLTLVDLRVSKKKKLATTVAVGHEKTNLLFPFFQNIIFEMS